MFDDLDSTIHMLEGAYRKLKTYYYYNKNFIIIREKIARFESNSGDMNCTMRKLAACLMNTNGQQSKSYLETLCSDIDFYCLPKKFNAEESNENNLVSNCIPKNKTLSSVNFFIDMPIELHILDALWTLFIGRVIYDNESLSDDVYGNTLHSSIFTEDVSKPTEAESKHAINFSNNRMFNIYYRKYSQWRNSAFEHLESCYDRGSHSYLISLDIQSYYYNVQFSFKTLSVLTGKHSLLKKVTNLTKIIETVFDTYLKVIAPFRKDIRIAEKRMYPLPIGLMSSMIIGNLYLGEFDKASRASTQVVYYGRYVDDILLVYEDSPSNRECESSLSTDEVLNRLNIFKRHQDSYLLLTHSNLAVQKSKIKILHIDPNESRAILDAYNKNIRILPSQMSVLPNYDVFISDFEEATFVINNFGTERKIRDLGNIEVDPFRVSRFFSTLVHKQKNIRINDKVYSANVEEQINKISIFFNGSQCIEFYSNWLNYLYFLALSLRKTNQIVKFIDVVKENISNVNCQSLNSDVFRKKTKLGQKTRAALKKHLSIAVSSSIALDISLQKFKQFKTYNQLSTLLYESNLFDHSLVAIPLSNYLEYSSPQSFVKVTIETLGTCEDFNSMPKFKWSPRFIKYEEILLLEYFLKLKNGHDLDIDEQTHLQNIKNFYQQNRISDTQFEIEASHTKIEGYELWKYSPPFTADFFSDKLKIGIANVVIHESVCIDILKDPGRGMSIKTKETLRNILSEAAKNKVKILVFPELFLPIYWLLEVIDFARKSQIAIITGLQYVRTGNDNVLNLLSVILPFRSGFEYKYMNSFVFIREKNDYSPIELEGLANYNLTCKNSPVPRYQVFHWNNLSISPYLCFEFTDIFARAIVKNKCDILTVCELNRDTNYFSDIVNSIVRDLHAVVIQANTSDYGDSRITCPYDRDSKDILKIKGGDNEFIIVGTVKLQSIIEYQANYDRLQRENIERLRKLSSAKSKTRKRVVNCQTCSKNKSKPEIKKLPARFSIHYAVNKLILVSTRKIFNIGVKDSDQ